MNDVNYIQTTTNMADTRIQESVQTPVEFLEQLGESLHVGLMAFSPELKMTFSNAQAWTILDLKNFETKEPADLFTLLFLMTMHGDPKKRAEAERRVEHLHKVIRQATQQTELSTVNFQITTPSGRNVNVRATVHKDQKVFITIEDKTQNVSEQETLKAVMQMYGTGVWHWCFLTNSFTYQSRYFDDILTADEKEIFSKGQMHLLIDEKDQESYHELRKNLLLKGGTQTTEFQLNLAKSGKKHMKCFVRSHSGPTGEIIGFYCYFLDVTEYVNTRGALEEAKYKSETLLKSKSEFLARMSHEVRTPLNAVIGITDALIQHHNDEHISPKLKLIERSAQNVLRILDETLQHEKLETTEYKIAASLADPAHVIERVCSLWETQAARTNVTIRHQIDSRVPRAILFDEHRYEQCLNNLISNAVKFTEGGVIDVLLTLTPKGKGPERLVLAVKDNGIGMTPDQQTRIFEAYVQADDSISRRFGGTGLGLNITKRIIEMMDGQITVKSELGKGTMFLVTIPLKLQSSDESSMLVDQIMGQSHQHIPVKEALPVAKPQHIAPQPVITAQETPQREQNVIEHPAKDDTDYSALKVLVVDDNATNHLVIKSLLEGVVGEIYTANNGREALDVLEVQDIDIVLMDIHMPVMDGIEATLAIRSTTKSWSDVLIIALTADPEYQQHRLCMNIGMDYALAKPIKLAEILDAFNIVLNANSDTQLQTQRA